MSLGPPGAQLNPEEADNFEDIEKQFAVKVVQHMSTYWSILERMQGSKLRLTKMDDEIYDNFMKHFPDFDPAATIDEDEMKSKEGKAQWREFINEYEKKVEDYNFGAMLRANAKTEYGEKETIFGTLKDCSHRQSTILRFEDSCKNAVLRGRDRKVCMSNSTLSSPSHEYTEIAQV